MPTPARIALITGASGGIGVAKDLSALLIGMNPMDTEAIWEKMLRKTFWGPVSYTHLTLPTILRV